MNIISILLTLVVCFPTYSQEDEKEAATPAPSVRHHINITGDVGVKEKNVLSPYLKSRIGDAFDSMENQLITQQSQLIAQQSQLHTMRQLLLGRGGIRAEKREQTWIPEGNTKKRIEFFESFMDSAKAKAVSAGNAAKRQIDGTTYPGTIDEQAAKRLMSKSQVDKNVNKVEDGAELQKKEYRKLEESAQGTEKVSKLERYSANLQKGLTQSTAAIGKISTLINTEKPWQERTQAGFEMAASLVELLPDPIGDIGSVVFNLIAACFGAASPTTNEYRKLRNQIMSGVTTLFDDYQKADAMGCIYKIEFLTGILEVTTAESMTDKEFYAIILLGGIDIAVTTLGTFKFKMNDYRDKNTIEYGRRSLEMAHFYVQLAEARDMLHGEILQYIQLAGSKAGITSKFFLNTKALGRKDYQNLFWWEETCCEKGDKYFSALLAYNVPTRKHAGSGNAVDQLYEFLKKYRTQEYYDDEFNSISEDVILTYDTTSTETSTTEAKYQVVARPLPVDSSSFYKYKNVYSLTYQYYLGLVDKFDFNVYITHRYSLTRSLICDKDNGRQVWNFGNTATNAYEDPIKFTPIETPTPGERLVGILTLEYGGNEYFITQTKKLGTAYTSYSYSKYDDRDGRMTRWKIKNTLKSRLAGTPPYELAAICKEGKGRDGSNLVWNTKVREAKMRVFRARLKGSGWGSKTLYLVSPAGEYSDDDDNVYFITNDSDSGQLFDIGTTVAADTNEKTLTAAAIKESDPWRKFWFEQVPV